MTISEALQKMKTFALPPGLPQVLPGERKRFLVKTTESYEIILMLWGPRAATPIHDHGDSRCWMRLIDGALIETTFQGSVPLPTKVEAFDQGMSFIVDKLGFHRLENPESKLAVSLHLYASPLRVNRCYDEDHRRWVTTDLTLDGDLHDVF